MTMPDDHDSKSIEALATGFGGGEPTMSTMEIADLTSKRHDHVMRDTRKMLTELYGEEAVPKFGGSYVGQDNTRRPCFDLPKRETLILVSGYNIGMRAKIIDRWQELEASKAAPVFAIPQSYADALRLAADNADRADQAEAALAIAGPKADALDMIAASEGSLTFTQAAKVIGVKRDSLTRWMHAEGWIYRQNESWVAYQQHIQNGRLEYKEANYTDQKTGMKVSKPYCHVTQKGLAKLATVFCAASKQAA